jgi:uncharacterized protein YoxC
MKEIILKKFENGEIVAIVGEAVTLDATKALSLLDDFNSKSKKVQDTLNLINELTTKLTTLKSEYTTVSNELAEDEPFVRSLLSVYVREATSRGIATDTRLTEFINASVPITAE